MCQSLDSIWPFNAVNEDWYRPTSNHWADLLVVLKADHKPSDQSGWRHITGSSLMFDIRRWDFIVLNVVVMCPDTPTSTRKPFNGRIELLPCHWKLQQFNFCYPVNKASGRRGSSLWSRWKPSWGLWTKQMKVKLHRIIPSTRELEFSKLPPESLAPKDLLALLDCLSGMWRGRHWAESYHTHVVCNVNLSDRLKSPFELEHFRMWHLPVVTRGHDIRKILWAYDHKQIQSTTLLLLRLFRESVSGFDSTVRDVCAAALYRGLF